MALVIEDGSIVDGANSYVTAEEFVVWANNRFGSDRAGAVNCDADAERLILRATDYFEAQSFIGTKKQSTQLMQWPRNNVYIDGYYESSSSIPVLVKRAIFELAYAEEQGSSELSSVDRKVKREKVDVIEVEYADSSASSVINRAVSSAMSKLLDNYGHFNRVIRI